MRVGAFGLEGVSFQVRADGPPLAIIGPNGAGKTTLLNVLSGLAKADRGRVLLDGRDFTEASPIRRARAGIRRTFQGVRVLDSFSLRRNVELAYLGARNATFTRPLDRQLDRRGAQAVESCLRALELDGVASARAGAVSFGQRKLLTLAMASVGAPRVLLLDEPVAGLHPAAIDKVRAFLSDLDCVRIIVEHDLDFLEALGCGAVLLDGGKVAKSGVLAEVLASPAAREAYS